MNPISRTVHDIRTTFAHRQNISRWQKKFDRQAPKVGDLAPDFTLADSIGMETVTLSDFRHKKPVALVFGSFT